MKQPQIIKFQRILQIIKLITLILGALVFVVSRYAFIFFLIAMIPTMLGILFDRNENKSISATVCTFNLMGILPYLSVIWDSSNINATSKFILTDLETWITVYFLSFVGLLFVLLLPGVVSKVYTARSKLEIENLQKQLDKLNKEWDFELEENKKQAGSQKLDF